MSDSYELLKAHYDRMLYEQCIREHGRSCTCGMRQLHPEPNSTPLGRLRLELKALGDAAATQSGGDCHCCECLPKYSYHAAQSKAYYHALDLVMALERE